MKLATLATSALLMCLTGVTAIIPLTSVEHIFAFGDSYTATGYTPSNPNFFPNFTLSGGLVWQQYLALSSPAKLTQLYTLAVVGATVNQLIVPAALSPSFIDQVTVFEAAFPPTSTVVRWNAENTLFTVFFGINDIGYTVSEGKPFLSILNAVFASYVTQIQRLYSLGAREFLLLGVPPTERTPDVARLPPAVQQLFRSNVDAWNQLLGNFVANFSNAFPNARVVLYDTQPVFNFILDNPLPLGFQNTLSFCPAYSTVFNNPNAFIPACTFPLNQYFWYDFYHPTSPVHQYLAENIVEVLNSLQITPNATSTSSSPTSSVTLTLSVPPQQTPFSTITNSATPSVSFNPNGAGAGAAAPSSTSSVSASVEAIDIAGTAFAALAGVAMIVFVSF